MKQFILFLSFVFISFLGFTQPTNLSVSNINSTDVTLSWDNGGCSVNYTLRIKVAGASSWQQGISITNSPSGATYTLTNLLSSTTYQWRVKCGGGWSNTSSFTTTSCSALSQSVSDFIPNPLFGYGNQNKSYTNLALVNTGTCDINIRPEFIISHQDSNLQQGDITIKFENPGFPGTWLPLSYTILGGDVVGFWNYPIGNDPTGAIWNQGANDTIAVRVHFNNSANNPNSSLAPLGIYTAIWSTQEVDSLGNIIQTLAQDTISLSLTTCSASPPSSTITGTDLTCHGDSTGSAIISLVSNLNYCTSSPGDTNNSNIELVHLDGENGTSINNNTISMCDQYEDYTAQSVTLAPSQSYSINISLGTCNTNPGGAAIDSGGVFIDWNQDGNFDGPNEKVSTFGGQISPSSHNISFTVPSNAVPGATRMRVVSQAQSNSSGFPSSAVSACAVGSISPPNYPQPWSGATEDYTIMITGSTFLWSNGATSQQITGVPAGIYSCTVTNNGCSSTETITLAEPLPISVVENTTNVLCNGDNSGTGTITATGGSGLLNINWNGVNTNALLAGNYTYIVTDDSGCVYTNSITITEPSEISVLENTTDVLCNGDSSGTATINATGGSGILNVNWNGNNPNALPYGTHYYTVTDTNSCTYSDSVTINQPNNSLQINTQGIMDQTSCSNPNGNINIIVSGGTSSYYYLWSTGDSTQDVNSLSEGAYSIIVTDQNGCIDSASFAINLVTNPILISFATSDYNGATISCNGEVDGYIIGNASGGAGQLNYLWSNGETTSQINNLGAGTYSLTITDSVGCTEIDTIILIQPDLLTAIPQFSQTSCFGLNSNLSVSLNIAGGTSGYIENWYTTNPDSISIGEFCTYTVTDTNNCSITDTFTANLPPPLIINGYQTDVLCHGDNSGAAAFVVSGGFPPYSYLWSNGDTNPTATNLTAGTYNCIISDGSGCTYIDSLIVSEPLNPITVNETVLQSINCFGDNTGIARIIANGGVPIPSSAGGPYIYSWQDDPFLGLPIISGLYSGYAVYSVTDDNGCVLTDSIFIPENDSIFTTNILSDYNGLNISCNGENNGSININVNGGVAPFVINWSNGKDSTFIDSLIAGTYHLSITDTFGCTFNDTISLIEPTVISLVNHSQTNVSCNGYLDGSFSVFVNGGVPDYTVNGQTNISNIDTIVFNNISAGSYIFNIIDQNGCVLADSVIVTEPAIMTPILSISNYNGVNISCKGFTDGFIMIDTIIGGNSPYNISWTDLQNGNSINNANSLTVGLYNLTIIDSLNCLPIYTQDFLMTEPSFALNSYIDSSSSNVSCNSYCDGKLISTAFNGTPPYTFNWIYPNGNTISNDTIDNLCPGNYNLTITDNNGCINQLNSVITEPAPLNIILDSISNASYNGANDGLIQTQVNGGNGNYSFLWLSGQNTPNINGLVAGQYQLTVNDQLGCFDTKIFTISEPAPISINFDSTFSSLSTSCFGVCDGAIYINPVISPTAFFTCYWQGPNGFTSTNEDITNLCPGFYSLYIVSSLGDSMQYNFEIIEPQLLTTNIASDSIICFGGTALLTTYSYGGTMPYSYFWSTNNSNNLSTFLSEGTHHVTVTDANGCIAEDSTILNNPDSMQLQATITNISCNNLSDGIITITHNPGGGTSPYLYSIDNLLTFNSSGIFNSLGSGNYTITVQDSNGCQQSISSTLLNPLPLNYQTAQSTDSVSCFGSCDGFVDFDYGFVQNGTPTQYWSGGAINGDLCPGVYSCTFIDGNSCTTSVNNITIVEPPLLELTLTSSGPTCYNNGNNGLAVATVTGGTPFSNSTYSYLWGNGSTSNATYGLSPGPIACIVTDANGCDTTANITVNSNPNPFLIGITNIGDSLLIVDTAIGGNPVSYLWNTGATVSSIVAANNGQYWVVATDINGCTSDTAFFFVNNHNTVDIVDVENTINVFPNPTNGVINILSEEYIESIEILNNIGNVIFLKERDKNVQKQFKIDISQNARGIYMIRVKINNQIINHKIILQ